MYRKRSSFLSNYSIFIPLLLTIDFPSAMLSFLACLQFIFNFPLLLSIIYNIFICHFYWRDTVALNKITKSIDL